MTKVLKLSEPDKDILDKLFEEQKRLKKEYGDAKQRFKDFKDYIINKYVIETKSIPEVF